MLFEPILAAFPLEVRAQVISYPRDETLGLSELAAYVHKRLPAGKSVLVAESFSGLVALAMLPNAIDRISGVIFVGAFAEPPRPLLLRFAPMLTQSAVLVRSLPSFLLRQLCLGADATAAEIRLLREAIASVAPRVLAQRLAIVAKPQLLVKPPSEIPCCYVRATHDRLVPAACAGWFEKKFRGCQLEEVDGPHFLMQAKPRESAKRITGQLRRMTI